MKLRGSGAGDFGGGAALLKPVFDAQGGRWKAPIQTTRAVSRYERIVEAGEEFAGCAEYDGKFRDFGGDSSD